VLSAKKYTPKTSANRVHPIGIQMEINLNKSYTLEEKKILFANFDASQKQSPVLSLIYR
jgi:hypothetical protein